MRNLSRTILVCAVIGAAVSAAVAVAGTRIPVFYKGELPGPVAEDIGAAMQPIDKAPKHDVIATEKVKMYGSGWARVLDKARHKAEAAGGDTIVVTSWGFDPTSTTDVKKLERVKQIEFEITHATAS